MGYFWIKVNEENMKRCPSCGVIKTDKDKKVNTLTYYRLSNRRYLSYDYYTAKVSFPFMCNKCMKKENKKTNITLVIALIISSAAFLWGYPSFKGEIGFLILLTILLFALLYCIPTLIRGKHDDVKMQSHFKLPTDYLDKRHWLIELPKKNISYGGRAFIDSYATPDDIEQDMKVLHDEYDCDVTYVK